MLPRPVRLAIPLAFLVLIFPSLSAPPTRLHSPFPICPMSRHDGAAYQATWYLSIGRLRFLRKQIFFFVCVRETKSIISCLELIVIEIYGFKNKTIRSGKGSLEEVL